MIDCHLHLQDLRLGSSDEIIEAARRESIACLVVNGTGPGDWANVAELALAYPEVIPSFGLHPWRVNGIDGFWSERLAKWLLDDPLAGVGEIGLDRWIKGNDPLLQREVFREQLALAAQLGRPVSVHCLKSWGTLLECLAETDLSAGCLLHSYGGPAEMVEDFAALGIYFSLSGYFFRPEKAQKLKTFENVPDDRLLLETDAPDMLPPAAMILYPREAPDGEPINHPANLVAVYAAYASWRGIEADEAKAQVKENFKRWFFGGGRACYLSRFPALSVR